MSMLTELEISTQKWLEIRKKFHFLVCRKCDSVSRKCDPVSRKCDPVSKKCDPVSWDVTQFPKIVTWFPKMEGIRNSIRWPCFPKRGPGFQRKWFDFFQETGRHQKFKLTVPFKGNFFFELMPTKCLHLLSWATNHTNISKIPSSSYVGKTRQLSWCGCDQDQNQLKKKHTRTLPYFLSNKIHPR